jgi:predicted TIM-barrel fold metal-dependent hydrolase
MHAVIHSLNEWLYETWQFNYEGRIFTAPVITLPIVEKAIEELEWCVERGARTVLIRPAPVPGVEGSRSFGYEEFDPFWKRVTELDVLVSMHSSDSGYARYQSDWTGAQEMLPFKPDAFRYLTMGSRPIEDSMAAFICHGVFARHADLRVAVIENGGAWVVPLLHHLKDVYRKMPHAFDGDPVEQFKRHVWISPFHEDDLAELIDATGDNHILFGSDFPHPEGLANPRSYIDHLPEGLADDAVGRIMGGNLAEIMRVPVTV